MNKIFNKSMVVVIAIGVLATVFLVVIFQSPLIKKTNQIESKDNISKKDDNKIKTKTFSDEDLGIKFNYPEDLSVITNGEVPDNQLMWLEVNSFLTKDLLKEKYWQENLGKLAVGEMVVLPGDLYVKKSELKATVGNYPAVVYSEISYKNCLENFNDKLIVLIDDRLVVLTLRHAPGFIASDLQVATSTTELVNECTNQNLDYYNTNDLVEKIKSGNISDNFKVSINYFTTILSSLEVTKTKLDLSSSTSTVAIINVPSLNDSGVVTVGVDEVVMLHDNEALAQMKKEKVCDENCQVPEAGYAVNQTKKVKEYPVSFSPNVLIKYSESTSTPAQITQVSLPVLIDYLKQNSKNDLIFDVYFNDKGDEIVGLKQK